MEEVGTRCFFLLYFCFLEGLFSDLRGWKKLVPDVVSSIYFFWKVYFSDLRGWKKLVPDVVSSIFFREGLF